MAVRKKENGLLVPDSIVSRVSGYSIKPDPLNIKRDVRIINMSISTFFYFEKEKVFTINSLCNMKIGHGKWGQPPLSSKLNSKLNSQII